MRHRGAHRVPGVPDVVRAGRLQSCAAGGSGPGMQLELELLEMDGKRA